MQLTSALTSLVALLSIAHGASAQDASDPRAAMDAGLVYNLGRF